jgi:ribosomal protein RSM22 (predicted rRNA methylase)
MDDWTTIDWNALDRLRHTFIHQKNPETTPYWTCERDLASYDMTFAERIGWKWDAVLSHLRALGWTPNATNILDWGCGTAIASRRVLSSFPKHSWSNLTLWDHSALATQYAEKVLHDSFPDLSVTTASSAIPDNWQEDQGLLLISHVINELTPSSRADLIELARQAQTILWVEPGTYDDSRSLISVREELSDDFTILAPCTHNATCGLLTSENERHWCHHFAKPPTEAFTNSDWAKFGQRMEIDLRHLPYSFLVLERTSARQRQRGLSRIIGTPRQYKGLAKILSCQEAGVSEFELQKRDNAKLWKELRKGHAGTLRKWEISNGRIIESSSTSDG